MDDKMFPILRGIALRRHVADFPKEIPWNMVEKYKEQIEHNHGQTLERLAERGGLSPGEIYLAANKIDDWHKPFLEVRGMVFILDLLEKCYE